MLAGREKVLLWPVTTLPPEAPLRAPVPSLGAAGRREGPVLLSSLPSGKGLRVAARAWGLSPHSRPLRGPGPAASLRRVLALLTLNLVSASCRRT